MSLCGPGRELPRAGVDAVAAPVQPGAGAIITAAVPLPRGASVPPWPVTAATPSSSTPLPEDHAGRHDRRRKRRRLGAAPAAPAAPSRRRVLRAGSPSPLFRPPQLDLPGLTAACQHAEIPSRRATAAVATVVASASAIVLRASLSPRKKRRHVEQPTPITIAAKHTVHRNRIQEVAPRANASPSARRPSRRPHDGGTRHPTGPTGWSPSH